MKSASSRRIALNYETIIFQGDFSNIIDNAFVHLIKGVLFLIEILIMETLMEERAASRACTLQHPKWKPDKDEEVASVACDQWEDHCSCLRGERENR